MQSKTEYCTQCGAEIKPGEVRCPYCGSSYEHEAEREYMRKLEQVRSNLHTVGNVGEKTSRYEAGRIKKRVARTVGIILVIAAAFYGLGQYMESRKIAKNLEEYNWKAENFPELDRLYEAGDYDALMAAYRSAQDQKHPVYEWDHYVFCQVYETVGYMKTTLELREEGFFEKEDAVLLLHDELELRGISWRRDVPEEDEKLIEELRAPYRNDLAKIFNASEEEIEAFDQNLKQRDGYPDYKICREYVKNHPEILIQK